MNVFLKLSVKISPVTATHFLHLLLSCTKQPSKTSKGTVFNSVFLLQYLDNLNGSNIFVEKVTNVLIPKCCTRNLTGPVASLFCFRIVLKHLRLVSNNDSDGQVQTCLTDVDEVFPNYGSVLSCSSVILCRTNFARILFKTLWQMAQICLSPKSTWRI
jgi:hypothetical protein